MPRRFEPATDKSPFWRADAREGGPSCCVSDIGVHAEFIMRYLTGRRLQRLSARLQGYTPGHSLDDNAFILGDLGGGAFASIWCSQVSIGRHNDIAVRVVGSKGALEWQHKEADKLYLHRLGQPEQILRKGDPALGPLAGRHAFIPLEHPEGVLEAFGALYKGFCNTLIARKRKLNQDTLDSFPTIEDGLAGIHFVQTCLKSNSMGGAWISLQ